MSEAAAVLVPVKAFSKAKMRLASVLSPEQRAALARKMAEHVIRASKPLPVVVVCDDIEVADWAGRLGARALPEPGLGLNGAVNAAFAQLGSEGYGRVVVAHADLPLASELAWLADIEGIALVPDRREEGTNVISLPARCGFKLFVRPRVVLTSPRGGQAHRPELASHQGPTLGVGRRFSVRYAGS